MVTGFFNPFNFKSNLDIRVKDGTIQWRDNKTGTHDPEKGWKDLVTLEELKSLGNVIEKFTIEKDKWKEETKDGTTIYTYDVGSKRIYDENLVTVGLQTGISKEAYLACARAQIAGLSQSRGKIVLQAFGQKPEIDIPAFLLFSDLAEEYQELSNDIIIVDKDTFDIYEIYVSKEKVHIREVDDPELKEKVEEQLKKKEETGGE